MDETVEKQTLGEFFKKIIWVFKLYLKMHPVATVTMLVSRVFLEITPLVYSYLYALIIDRLIQLSQSTEKNFSAIIPYLLYLAVYFIFINGLLRSVNRYASRTIYRSSRYKLRKLLYDHLQIIGIQNLEDPQIVNRIQRSQDWLYNTVDILNSAIDFISQIVKAVSAGIVIFLFSPFLVPVFIITSFLAYLPDQYFTKKDFRWQFQNTEGNKKAGSSASFLENPSTLHEISVLGAYKFLDRKYISHYRAFVDGLMDIFVKREVSGFFINLLDTSAMIASYALIFYHFIFNKISLGTATFQIRSIDMFSQALGVMLSEVTFLNDFSLKMGDIIKLFETVPQNPDGKLKLSRKTLPPAIEFINVSFKYPRSDKFVIKNLSFKIRSCQRVALVGHNGAGKTTLIKLLAKIYHPTEGQILINGIDLNDLSIKDWYRHLGVLFQDFNFYYHLSVKENIAIGQSKRKINDQKVINAAKKADAHSFIMDYPQKYDQIMGERFKGGIRPSSGQQQKIAIARFFYRNAPVAIFDEPTAAIDPVSEFKIFNQIYRFFKNKTVVLISHRFSTVRNADHIIVLDKGNIIEEGSHEHLIKLRGTYYHAYQLQAQGYQN